VYVEELTEFLKGQVLNWANSWMFWGMGKKRVGMIKWGKCTTRGGHDRGAGIPDNLHGGSDLKDKIGKKKGWVGGRP